MEMLIEYKSIEEALKVIIANTWLMTFVLLWVFGWWLKEHTKLNNKLIPTAILIMGACLGILVIEKSVVGLVLGLTFAFLIIGFYDSIKNTIEYFVLKKNKAP